MVSLIQNIFHFTPPGAFVFVGGVCLWLTAQSNDWPSKLMYLVAGAGCFAAGYLLYQKGLKSVEKIAENDNLTKERLEREKTNREGIRQRNIQLRMDHEKEKAKRDIVKGIVKEITR